MEWILLNTYTHPMDAQTDILLLESEGIGHRLEDAQTISIDPLLSQALGGAKLWVEENNAERAVALLRENYARRKEEHPDEYLEAGTPDWAKMLTRGLLIAAVLVIVMLVVFISNA
jgi:hypothetical protein